jgi:hypothetical protein
MHGLRLTDEWIPWEDYARTINESKICICSQSDPRRRQIKGKIFDYLACGTLVLTDDNTEIRKLIPAECLVLYEDWEDCLEKITWYVEHEEERRRVAAAGHRWFREHFDYKRYWSRVLTVAATGEGELPGLPGRPEMEAAAEAETARDPYAYVIETSAVPDAWPGEPQVPAEPGRRVPCSLPWYKLELHLDGSYGPCCHYRIPGEKMPATVQELGALWNSPRMRLLRKALVEGKLEGHRCAKCYDRMFAADHDIFGMGAHLPRYSPGGAVRDRLHAAADALYREGRVLLPTPPLELNVYTSEACNLNCVMCSQNRDFTEADTGAVKRLVRELGWHALDRFAYVGGETFLTRDALELLEFAGGQGDAGTCIYITSNGQLIHRHLDRLRRIENLFLTISIDGAGETYERIRRRASWERLTANLEELRRLKQDRPGWRLNFNSIVMNSTAECLEEIIDLAERVEASVFFMPINGGHPEEDIFAHPGALADREAFVATLERARAHARRRGAAKAADSLEKAMAWLDLSHAHRRAHKEGVAAHDYRGFQRLPAEITERLQPAADRLSEVR